MSKDVKTNAEDRRSRARCRCGCRRILAASAALGTVVAVLCSGPAIAPAAAGTGAWGTDPNRVWYRCRTVPLTWTLYIPPGSKLKLATERKFIERALAQVTAATGGAYTWKYVPTGDPHIVWRNPGNPTAYDLMLPLYYTTPEVDAEFLILPVGQPVPGTVSITYPFRAGYYLHGGIAARAYERGDGSTEYWADHGQAYFEAKAMARANAKARMSYYVWAAASVAGDMGATVNYSLTKRTKSTLKAMAAQSCQNVADWPAAVPVTGHAPTPDDTVPVG